MNVGLAEIVARLEHLEEENRALRAELEHRDAPDESDVPAVVSRRQWLARGAAVAVGAVAGTAAMPRAAHAADNNPLVIGVVNAGTNLTNLHASRGADVLTPVMSVINDHATTGAGLFGYGPSYGLLGFSDKGTGVWGKASGDGTHAAVGVGGYIDNLDSPESAGVHGMANGAFQVGVRAESTAGTAVVAMSELGVGVYATSESSPAVVGHGVDSYGGLFHSPHCDLGLGTAGRPAPTNDMAYHYWGDIVVQSSPASTLWCCVQAGTPGSWRRLAGTTTAGALTLLDAPVRVYDSRPGQPPVGVLPKSTLANGVDRTLDCTVASSGVPFDALGVLINLTAVNQSAAGYLSVRANGAAYTGTSNLNWTAANATIANACTVKCGTGATITVRLGGAALSANVIVDVVGYYR